MDYFMFKEGLKNVLPIKIGFKVESIKPYNKVMASTRLRCYDIINFLDKKLIIAGLYRSFKKYDLVIFQKDFSDDAIKLANKLKSQGTKVIFDINVNYLEKKGEANSYIKQQQTDNILRMIDLSDALIVSSNKLKEIFSKHHSEVVVIEENISDSFFRVAKNHKDIGTIYLTYCGYSIKAKELLQISGVLKELHKKYPIKLLFICEKDPQLNIMPYEYLRYNQKILPYQLVKGDIKVAPRDLSNSYNWGHSFTKVGYPMSVGLPAVASPIPSYMGRNVVICYDDEAWYTELIKLIESWQYRAELGLKSREFVKQNFSIDKIGTEYIRLFQKYI